MEKQFKVTKRLFMFFGAVCLCLLYGCTSEPSRFADYSEEEIYDTGYDEGYDKGYEDGIAYVLSTLCENANGYDRFMNIEDIDDSIHSYLESQNFEGDCCDVRDCIIYHPDFEHYVFRDMLDELIQSCIDE